MKEVILKPAVILKAILSDNFYSFAKILFKIGDIFLKCEGLLNVWAVEMALF